MSNTAVSPELVKSFLERRDAGETIELVCQRQRQDCPPYTTNYPACARCEIAISTLLSFGRMVVGEFGEVGSPVGRHSEGRGISLRSTGYATEVGLYPVMEIAGGESGGVVTISWAEEIPRVKFGTEL